MTKETEECKSDRNAHIESLQLKDNQLQEMTRENIDLKRRNDQLQSTLNRIHIGSDVKHM
jgi:hypothetical protein